MVQEEAKKAEGLGPEEFLFFKQLIHQGSGIFLDEGKRYLLKDRLGHVVTSLGLRSIGELYRRARYNLTEDLKSKIIEALTTNETLFFRDKSPFEFLAKRALPALAEARKASRVLRIWSAACSTGQEVYSILMMLAEHMPDLLNWKLEVLATDISDDVMRKAREGVYSHLEIQRGLPASLLARYFKKHPRGWIFDERLRKLVTYRRMNLNDSFVGLGQFDIIFSRYVLIYFDLETKRSIFEKIQRALRPGGYLFLGASEGVFGITDLFRRQTDGDCVYYQGV